MGKQQIVKLGTVECDLVEATPVVFKERLYRFTYIRTQYYTKNPLGVAYFTFIDAETGEASPPFAHTYVLGCAHAEGDRMFAYGSNIWGGQEVRVFWSDDLQSWESKPALDMPGWGFYNTSVCKGADGYIMAVEAGEPEAEVGARFTIFFARSNDLINWEFMSTEYNHTRERYAACPAIRYLDDGYYYMVYLEAILDMQPTNYQLYIARSRDLRDWQLSELNPVMVADDDDRKVADERLDAACRERIATAVNINNSDFDLCEFEGRTHIVYSWGNQHGVEHLATAYYDGPMADFLQAWFRE